jgi:malonate transporter
MLGVVAGFSVIWSIIAVGYVVGRLGVLGPEGRMVLSRVVYYIATPALMLETLSRTDPQDVFSVSLATAGVSAVLAGVLYMALARWLLKRSGAESIIGAMSASVLNLGNLGIPVAVYVLGSASFVAPALIFQLVVQTPLFLLMLDSATSGRRVSAGNILRQMVRNPVIVASAAGLMLAFAEWDPPELAMEPVSIMGGLAVPGALIAFGLSLHGSRPFQVPGDRIDVGIAAAVKLVFQPAVAWLAAAFLFGIEGHDLFAMVVIAALPSAQNVFIAASRFDRGVTIAKDAVLVTTVLAVPSLIAVAAVLS